MLSRSLSVRRAVEVGTFTGMSSLSIARGMAPDGKRFIDADKTGYPVYWAELASRMRPGGIIVVDNVFQGGRIIDEAEQGESVVALREFNKIAVEDERFDVVMLPIADGLTLAQRR